MRDHDWGHDGEALFEFHWDELRAAQYALTAAADAVAEVRARLGHGRDDPGWCEPREGRFVREPAPWR